MSKRANIDGVSPQAFLFVQTYMTSLNVAYSAYVAGYCDNLKEKIKYEDITTEKKTLLCKQGKLVLKNRNVKNYLIDTYRRMGKSKHIADINEILVRLTSIIRMIDKKKDTATMNTAIKAIEVLIKYYPEFTEGNRNQDNIVFSRGVDLSGNKIS